MKIYGFKNDFVFTDMARRQFNRVILHINHEGVNCKGTPIIRWIRFALSCASQWRTNIYRIKKYIFRENIPNILCPKLLFI